jgi:hypothetical protein
MTDDVGDSGGDQVRELARQQMLHSEQAARRYAATGDRYDLDETIMAVEAAIELVRGTRPSELVAYLRVAEQWYVNRWILDRRTADLDVIIGRCAEIDEAPPAGPVIYAAHQTVAATAYQGRFDEHGDRADLDEAIRRWRLAVEASGPEDPLLGMRRTALAEAERARAAVADEAFRAMLDLELPGDDDDARDLCVRALGFVIRYQDGGPRADADRAVALLERMKAVARDAESVARADGVLGDVAMLRAGRARNAADFEDAVRHYTAALDEASRRTGRPPEEAAERFTRSLARLANALTLRAGFTGDRAHVEDAVRVLNQHAADPRLTSVDRGQLWTSMAAMLSTLVQATHRPEDAVAAVAAARTAVEATNGTFAEPAALSQLATGLYVEYELVGGMTLLAEAAAAASRAAETSEDSDPARMLRWLNAGSLRFVLGESEGDAEQIDRALELLAEPAGGPGEHQAMALLRVQQCWRARYDITGRPDDLDAAIASGLAVWDSPQRHGPEGGESAVQLSDALVTRGLLAKSIDDVDHALRVGTELLDSLSPDHPGTPHLLFRLRAMPARHRFALRGELTDLDLAAEALEAALRVAEADADVVPITLGLAEVLRSRFGETRDEADLRSAADHYRALIERLPLPEPAAWPASLGLSETLWTVFSVSGSIAAGQEAIVQARDVAVQPDGDPATAVQAWTVLCKATTDVAVASPASASLSDAVRAGQAAVATAEAANQHQLLPHARRALAGARYAHYLRERSEDLFEPAAEDFRVLATETADDSQRAHAYAQLGRLHRTRHAERRSPEDLDRAIEFLDRAVITAPKVAEYARDLQELRAHRPPPAPLAAEVTASAPPQRATEAKALLARFAETRDPAALIAAITAWFAAASGDPERYGSRLRAALSVADEGRLQLGPLRELYQDLATAPADPERPSQSVTFVILLHRRWRATLRPDAAHALRDAVLALREVGGTGAEFLLAAGEALYDLFSLTADESALRAAITVLDEFVVGEVGDPRRNEVIKILARARDRIGDSLNAARCAADLAEARWQLAPSAERARDLLAATERVVAALPPGHPERPSLVGNVANAALLVATLTHEPRTYPRAVTAARAAAAAVQDAAEPDEMLRGKAAVFLASALLLQLKENYDDEQADEAERLASGLLGHSQHGSHARLMLAEVLLLGQPEDHPQADPDVLDRALRCAREAAELIPEADRNHRMAHALLIKALLCRFVTVRNVDELTETLRHLGAVPSGDPNVWAPEIVSRLRRANTAG